MFHKIKVKYFIIKFEVKDDVYQTVTQAYSEKIKIRVLPTGVEPMTFRLLLRMLYH